MGIAIYPVRSDKDFIKKFRVIAPLETRGVQTDNGSEFLGEFEGYVREERKSLSQGSWEVSRGKS